MGGGGEVGLFGTVEEVCAAAEVAASSTKAIGRKSVLAILISRRARVLGYLNFYHSRKADFKAKRERCRTKSIVVPANHDMERQAEPQP
jgi:hypothetical protein